LGVFFVGRDLQFDGKLLDDEQDLFGGENDI